MTSIAAARTILLTTATLVVACTPGEDRSAVTDSAAAPATGSVSAGSIDIGAVPAGVVRLVTTDSGNAARYRVREQLVRRDLPNDAVGETHEVTGTITLDASGALVPGQSRFVVRTANFRSDSDRRDGYVRARLLQVKQHPTVEFAPTAVRGLRGPVPAAGTVADPFTFELVGDLTVRGVTRPTTWRVTARQGADGKVTGSAATRFTFADFTLTQPRVPVLLSVADTIALEYDFTMRRSDAGGE